MKNFKVSDHINYTHFVGEVSDLRHVERDNSSPYCLCKLKVQTEYQGKRHDPIEIDMVFWDALAIAMKNENIGKGDVLNVEGRLTIREAKGKTFFSITGNKVKIVRQMDGKEPFLHEVNKDSK